MSKPISEYDDPNDLRNLMANAKRLKEDEIYREAFWHLCVLQGRNFETALEREFYSGLAAYEELLSQKNGRKTRAGYTRRKLQNNDLITALEDWALQKTPTEGFKLLIEKNLVQLTGEYLVLKYSEEFSDEAIASATRRFEESDISVSDLKLN